VTLVHETQESPDGGQRMERLRVPFAGYESLYAANGVEAGANGADEFGS
jgi:hypothetical protein